ncbi:hypothetical protein RFI_22550 [Reticulomyxa filosa]|uniref:Uncharacterized protein n=1 Tax=Reticulomyxa filosa TaxID=46433 RepID=X6MLS8_RETFI|nr:hypothetical protein RFI_22550 [Reticulomyxa filosa]|eukprot:ETO14819.1 hypothetical protein RFI_22550 [Reticulomyxa filosa]
MDEKNQEEQSETDEKGLMIEIHVDDGSCTTKFDCHYEMIHFTNLNVGSLKEVTYKDVVNQIKVQFGTKFPGIMDDNYTMNVKWKLVSFKEAHAMLANESKDVQISDDSTLQEEFLDESDSETSSDENESTPKIIKKFLVRKIGNSVFLPSINFFFVANIANKRQII